MSNMSECDGAIYQAETNWWSDSDQSIMLTLAINIVVFIVVLIMYRFCASRSNFLKPVYSPLYDADTTKHPLNKQETSVDDYSDEASVSLEHTMMQRFFKMNTVLLALFALFAIPVLLPVYAINVYDGMDVPFAPPPPPGLPPNSPPFPPQLPGDPFIAEAPSMPPSCGFPPFSGVETFSLVHLPQGSPRVWASSLAMFILSVIFLVLIRREMEAFVSLRMKWLSVMRPERYAVRLVTSQHTPAPLGAGGGYALRPTGEEMMEVLKPIFGTDLAEVLVVPRHPFWGGAVGKGVNAAKGAADKGLSVANSAVSKAGTTGKEGLIKEAFDEFKMMALGEDTETSYILLFRTRAARFMALTNRTILTNTTVGSTTLCAKAMPAAAPEDYFWSSLSTPRWIIVAAWIGTILFFFFWNVPIALIQQLGSLESIGNLLASIGLGGFKEFVFGLSPTLTAFLQGFFPSVLLAVAIAVAYMIIPICSGLQGWESNVAVGLSTMRKFWLFNFFVIILASCIAGSLAETTEKIATGGTGVVFTVLGNAIPEQASFWLNFLLQDAMFLLPLMDILQLVPAAVFIIFCSCCGPCCRAKCGAQGTFTLKIIAGMQKLKYFKLYGRLSIVITATFFFAAMCPLILLIAIPWTVLLARVWDHNHKRIFTHPLYRGFDSGGVYWSLAIKQLKASLVVSQLVLAAVHIVSEAFGSGVCLLLLMFVTHFRFSRIIAYYEPMSEELALDACAKLDASAPVSDTFLADASAAYSSRFFNAPKPEATEIKVVNDV